MVGIAGSCSAKLLSANGWSFSWPEVSQHWSLQTGGADDGLFRTYTIEYFQELLLLVPV